MDPPPGFKPISTPRSRNRTKPSISELISELRDTFRKSDFDRVEETLVAREAKLKKEIGEKEREIGLLKENLQFEMLEKINIELELKKVKGERREVEENGGNGGCFDGRVVKGEMESERCERGLVGGKVGVLAEKKRLGGESSKKDGLGASGRRLGKGTAIDIGDGDKDECNLKATLNRNECRSVVVDAERQSSSRAVQKNRATRLSKPIGIMPGNDNDRVEEALLAREAILKAGIADRIGLLRQKNQSKKLERYSFEIEPKTVKRERCGEELVEKVGENGYGLCLDDGKVMKDGLRHGSCKLEVLKNRGVGGGDASAVAEVEGKKVEVLAEKKSLVGEPSKKDGQGASAGGRLGIGAVIDIEDSDEDEGNLQAALNRKETTPCVIADYEQKSLSGAVRKNFATRLAEPLKLLKQEFASRGIGTKIKNILDGLDNDVSSSSSSSSSSSGEFRRDSILRSLTSNKKMRTNAGSLGLNS